MKVVAFESHPEEGLVEASHLYRCLIPRTKTAALNKEIAVLANQCGKASLMVDPMNKINKQEFFFKRVKTAREKTPNSNPTILY